MTFLAQVDNYVRGEGVENAHPAIQMFGICAALQWTHLPSAGGIYDQNPELLEKFRVIWSKQAEHEKAEQAKRKSEASRKNSRASRGR